MEKEKIDRRKIGTAYEQEAVLFLKQKGYRIIARNYYCKQGEIDIIAVDQNYLVFVEVKYRSKKKEYKCIRSCYITKTTSYYPFGSVLSVSKRLSGRYSLSF